MSGQHASRPGTFLRRHARPLLWLLGAMSGLGALGLACSSDPKTDNAACQPSIESIQATIFETSCADAGCHGTEDPATALVLVGSNVEANLVHVSAPTCIGEKHVVPGSPSASFLYQKVAKDSPACGTQMPPAAPLTDEQIRCIGDWIAGIDPAITTATSSSTGSGGSGGGTGGAGGESCDDRLSDPTNCGACGKHCAPGQTCVDGVCQCGTGTASLAADVQPIFTQRCATATCHAGNTPKAGLLLTDGNSHANLVGQPSGCNMPIVVPGAPEGSYLIHKLTNYAICFGGRMPPSSPLTTSQLQTVTDWICAGALDD